MSLEGCHIPRISLRPAASEKMKSCGMSRPPLERQSARAKAIPAERAQRESEAMSPM